MRNCCECTACCTWLVGNAYGHEFGNGKSCKFLCKNGCSVHEARPQTCENYFCAWAQELIDHTLRPDQCNVIATVENINEKQCIKLIPIDNQKINNNIINYFKNWSEIMNTPVFYLDQSNWREI